MEKNLGVDLGTNSIGLALRNENEFEWFGVYTFKKGVGEGKSGEFSFAAYRTTHRSTRRLYNARRYRKWETLKVLIEDDLCPLAMERLNKWKHYEKEAGRIFPVDDLHFQNWIKLDFNNDNNPDYSSPYQLRKELIKTKLDLSIKENRYKLGRALYHIAQRRGFKSSRKTGDNEKTSVYNGSTETKTIGIKAYQDLLYENETLGAAFAYLEDKGIRVRNRYTLRKDYQKEVEKIITFQEVDSALGEKIIKAIFYQRPLRSQKGLVGKCTLEKSKYRCPVSHPKFEAYRAWSFINNIKYKENESDSFKPLPIELKQNLYDDVFFRKSKSNFKFKDIRKYLIKNERANWILNYKSKLDETNVAGCSVSARLKAVFGDDWETMLIKANWIDKRGKSKTAKYDIEDVWHILFSYEDKEIFEEFLRKKIHLNDKQIKDMIILFENFPVGYASLSLKAINNILPFLKEGLIYSEAVMLAKIPELIGKNLFEDNKELIINAVKDEIRNNRNEKDIVFITNNLISKYKTLTVENKFAYKDTTYHLEELDKKEILQAIEKYYGQSLWQKKDESYKKMVIEQVTNKYQTFFFNSKKEYFKFPHLLNQLKDFLIDNFNIGGKEVAKLYHPSQIDIYHRDSDQVYLKSPKTAAFKNPMAYKTLYHLRDVINHLIKTGKIDSETKIVIELARELNDKNKRAAIETYQRKREIENREFAKAISELTNDKDFEGNASPENKSDIDKFRLWTEQIENQDNAIIEIFATKNDIKKYRLWKEQNARCFYTGKSIRLTDLFNTNIIDFEHTIPRSKSFDNSMANLTVCFADYNRNIKRNRIPTELENYEDDWNGYSAIKPRIKSWIQKTDELEKQIDFWKFKSKIAIDKESKDYAIRQKLLRYFEFDYWKNKVDRFTRKDVPQGFINSQLTDTQIITKHAFHYLKTVFNKVDVQKGSITAEFRKIYQIQEKGEEKNRTKHHHHAIDAAVLTLIPNSAKREEILKRAYKYQESHQGQYHEKPYSKFNFHILKDIEKDILINNLSDKDKVLTKGKRIVRKRGRIVWLRDKDRKPLLDKHENKIPKIAQGDTIRGQLHEEAFYGKIRLPEKDESGNPLRNEYGKIMFSNEYWAVKRELLENLKISNGTIKDEVIDKHLKGHIEKQLKEGIAIKDITDFNKKKIRHIRIRAKAGRRFLSPNSLFSLKKQTYPSKYKHKREYYVKTGDNYAFALYVENNDYEKAKKKIVSINLLEVSIIKSSAEIKNITNFFEKTIEIGRGKTIANLYHVFKTGQRVLFYEYNREELKELGNKLSERLYYVKTLSDAKQGLILFQHHLEARNDEQLAKDFPKETFGQRGKNGFSKFSINPIRPRLLLSTGNLSCIIEGKDFTMTLDGKINFLF